MSVDQHDLLTKGDIPENNSLGTTEVDEEDDNLLEFEGKVYAEVKANEDSLTSVAGPATGMRVLGDKDPLVLPNGKVVGKLIRGVGEGAILNENYIDFEDKLYRPVYVGESLNIDGDDILIFENKYYTTEGLGNCVFCQGAGKVTVENLGLKDCPDCDGTGDVQSNPMDPMGMMQPPMGGAPTDPMAQPPMDPAAMQNPTGEQPPMEGGLPQDPMAQGQPPQDPAQMDPTQQSPPMEQPQQPPMQQQTPQQIPQDPTQQVQPQITPQVPPQQLPQEQQIQQQMPQQTQLDQQVPQEIPQQQIPNDPSQPTNPSQIPQQPSVDPEEIPMEKPEDKKPQFGESRSSEQIQWDINNIRDKISSDNIKIKALEREKYNFKTVDMNTDEQLNNSDHREGKYKETKKEKEKTEESCGCKKKAHESNIAKYKAFINTKINILQKRAKTGEAVNIMYGMPTVSMEGRKIKGTLAYAGVSLNDRIYLPEELAKGHEKVLPLLLNHSSIAGAEGELDRLDDEMLDCLNNEKDYKVGEVKLRWAPEKLTLFYEGVVDNKFFQKEIDDMDMAVSLGIYYDADSPQICNEYCYTMIKGAEFREVSLVYHAGFPIATIEAVESEIKKRAKEDHFELLKDLKKEEKDEGEPEHVEDVQDIIDGVKQETTPKEDAEEEIDALPMGRILDVLEKPTGVEYFNTMNNFSVRGINEITVSNTNGVQRYKLDPSNGYETNMIHFNVIDKGAEVFGEQMQPKMGTPKELTEEIEKYPDLKIVDEDKIDI